MWLSIVKTESPRFPRAGLAVQHVERLLRRVSKALDGAGVPYAIIGGNVVAAWVANVDAGAVRATKDVDILLRRSDLRRRRCSLGRSSTCIEVPRRHHVSNTPEPEPENRRARVVCVREGS